MSAIADEIAEKPSLVHMDVRRHHRLVAARPCASVSGFIRMFPSRNYYKAVCSGRQHHNVHQHQQSCCHSMSPAHKHPSQVTCMSAALFWKLAW